MGHFMLNVVQKDSKYDMIICKGIYLFHFRLDCNVQITIGITGHWENLNPNLMPTSLGELDSMALGDTFVNLN